MNYNDRWNRDKHKEFRKLKRSGYTDDMLIQHFGEEFIILVCITENQQ